MVLGHQRAHPLCHRLGIASSLAEPLTIAESFVRIVEIRVRGFRVAAAPNDLVRDTEPHLLAAVKEAEQSGSIPQG